MRGDENKVGGKHEEEAFPGVVVSCHFPKGWRISSLQRQSPPNVDTKAGLPGDGPCAVTDSDPVLIRRSLFVLGQRSLSRIDRAQPPSAHDEGLPLPFAHVSP